MEKITYAPALQTVLDLWHRANETNDAPSQYALAKILMKSSQPEIVKKAFTLFKKLANLDYTCVQTDAQYMLGVCYENGYGIQKSYPRAISWYKMAVNNVSNDLGPFYRDYMSKLRKALDTTLDELCDRPTPQELVDCMTDAAEGGDLQAQKFLMKLYRYGDKDREPDAAEAAYWTERAAESGDVEAIDQLGRMYYFGEGLERNLQKGRDLMVLAAERGSPSSAYFLGRHYEKMSANKRAVEWYRLCVELEIQDRDRKLNKMIKEINSDEL